MSVNESTTLELELVRYRTDEGIRAALISEGRKWIHVLSFDRWPLSVSKVARDERRFMTPLKRKDGSPYPIGRAVSIFRKSGRHAGITQAARDMLDLKPVTEAALDAQAKAEQAKADQATD